MNFTISPPKKALYGKEIRDFHEASPERPEVSVRFWAKAKRLPRSKARQSFLFSAQAKRSPPI